MMDSNVPLMMIAEKLVVNLWLYQTEENIHTKVLRTQLKNLKEKGSICWLVE